MPYSFRNRDEIRAPTRFDAPADEQRKVSYIEPDIDKEQYRSMPPTVSKSEYRGPVIPFNPLLPPAAFPTLDHLHQMQGRGLQIIDLTSLSEDADRPGHNQPNVGRSVRCGHGDLAVQSTTGTFPTKSGQRRLIPGATSSTHMEKSKPLLQRSPNTPIDLSYFRPRNNGTEKSILHNNMQRMDVTGELSTDDLFELDMMSSDEEEEVDAPQEVVRWDELSTESKLKLYQIISDAFPQVEATLKLQLDHEQTQEMCLLVLEHNNDLRREELEGTKHRRDLHEKLLRGARVSASRFRDIANLKLFSHVKEKDKAKDDNDCQSDIIQAKKAKAYLLCCSLSPQLFDGAWATIADANAGAPRERKDPLPASSNDHRNSDTPRVPGDSDKSPRLRLIHQSREGETEARPPIAPNNANAYNGYKNSNLFSKDPSAQLPQSTRPSNSLYPNHREELIDNLLSCGPTRPSIETVDSVNTARLLPPVEIFSRPIVSRRMVTESEIPVMDRPSAKAACTIIANEAERALPANPQTPTSTGALSRPSTPKTTSSKKKRRTGVGPEYNFLSNERPPGARRLKLTEKAIKAGALSPHTNQGRHPSGGTDGGPGAIDRAVKEGIRAAEMERADSAIDLSADKNDDDDVAMG